MPFKPKLFEQLDLSGKTAVVTGASGHLGQVIVQTLAELGCVIVLVDKASESFTTYSENVVKQGLDVRVHEVDFSEPTSRTKVFEEIKAAYDIIDICVNNAAFVGTAELSGWSCAFKNQSVETWRNAMEVNLTSVFELVKILEPSMRKSPSASLVNIGSVYGIVGPDWRIYEGTSMANPAAYSASKGAILQLTRWLATTLCPRIRVNSISPGGIERGQPDSFRDAYISRVPLERMAREEDFSGAVAFLCSDMSAYITGQNIVIDGGFTAW